ncbi:MAG: ABC transporter substrate-binding protein [Lachnospiraceae bacterium]|nr:ABC transporter substrate-binding protein [Lachnospiraceae bacterium]MDE6232280.1 ABC transporter substrate-binding protein [Lachnospiraceae bacterium]MDE6252524.1 ABC transporter substrate-binding protein [Lachnospiraceae bacterium]
MKLKKIGAIALSAAMIMSLAGCGSSSKEKKYNIGICQLVQHEALDAATKGFKDALKEKLGDNVKFDEQNAQGDSATCATIVNAFASSNVDLILANATAPLQSAAAATSTIPILGTSVTDYATALDISDWKGKTGVNVSGTSDLAPLDEQAAMLYELFPDAEKVGLVYCSAEPNSQYQVEVVTEELENLGYKCTSYSFVDSNDIASVVNSAVENSDVLYIPTDNTAASSTGVIDNICKPAKMPIITGEEGICEGCGVATLSISYYDIGYKTGEMAYEILKEGKDIKDMEIEYAPEVTKKYNPENCEALGITIPDDYVAIGE